MTRRHWVGEEWTAGGWAFRITAGDKGPEDHKLWVYGPGRWLPLDLGIPFVAMDVIGQNEDLLYEPPAKGGAKLRNELLTAYRDGWQKAWELLQRERAEKADREFYGDSA
jgi:hypothetical protein